MAKSIVFTSAVYPDCPAISPADGGVGDKCNADRDAALAASKVKAQIFTHLLYRHWDHYTGDKRIASVSGFGGDGRDARFESRRHARCAAVFARGRRLRVRLFAGLEGAGVYREARGRSVRSSTNSEIYTLDLTDPACEAGEGEHVAGRQISIRRTRRMGSIWRGAARRGRDMRATSSGCWCSTTEQRRRSGICCRSLITGWMSLRGRPDFLVRSISSARIMARLPSISRMFEGGMR